MRIKEGRRERNTNRQEPKEEGKGERKGGRNVFCCITTQLDQGPCSIKDPVLHI